jgi:predicted small integral membrane protein
MIIRILKIKFVGIIALLCLFYAGQNVANLEACYGAFAYVLSHVDHEAYAASFFPAIQNPILIWFALILVVGLEFTAGFLALKGSWDMWVARKAPAATFNGSKTFALLGCGTGIIVWMGLFSVMGGALFQMWDTAVGRQSLDGAFQFASFCAMTFIIVNMADD